MEPKKSQNRSRKSVGTKNSRNRSQKNSENQKRFGTEKSPGIGLVTHCRQGKHFPRTECLQSGRMNAPRLFSLLEVEAMKQLLLSPHVVEQNLRDWVTLAVKCNVMAEGLVSGPFIKLSLSDIVINVVLTNP